MDPRWALLATDQRQALQFFVAGLQDLCEPSVDQEELHYTASVLAHYALVSTQSTTEWPTPSNLSEVFDHFVADSSLLNDSGMMETAGAQCLLLTGFFSDQMRRRHNIRWYASLGASFYSRAAAHTRSPIKARLLDTIGRHFEPWRQCHARLGRGLRDRAYVLPSSPNDVT